MRKIKSLKEINKLPLQANLLSQVTQFIIEPFHSESEAQKTWNKLNVELWFLSNISDVPTDGDDRKWLFYAFRNIEFEKELVENMVISLSIIGSDGGGLYLMMDKELKNDILNILGEDNE